MTDTKTIIDRHDRYMSINYGRFPIAITRAAGSEMFDADGKRYVDLFAGFGAPVLGHCHPDLVAAVTEQANNVWHVGNLLHTEPQTRAAEAIAKHGFGGRSFFCHAGADANEAAIKLSRLHGVQNGKKRFGVISATQSFHGRSFGTMPATGGAAVREHYDPLPTGYTHVPYNDLAALEKAITDETAAVILEPIQGEGGVNVPSDDYLPAVRKLCTDRNVLMIMDEVWTGCGRTGKYFAHQHWDIEPDVMTLGKGIGGGLAVGVMCAKPEFAELNNALTQGKVRHATTLGGNCLSMAVTAKIFEVIERDNLTQRAADLGEKAMTRLRAMPHVTAVRGKGLFIGAVLDRPAKDVVKTCLDRGLLINGTQDVILRLAPALTVDETILNEGLDMLESVLGA